MTNEERQKLCAELRKTSFHDTWFIRKQAADEIERLAALTQSNANLDAVVSICPKCGKPVTSYCPSPEITHEPD